MEVAFSLLGWGLDIKEDPLLIGNASTCLVMVWLIGFIRFVLSAASTVTGNTALGWQWRSAIRDRVC